MLSDSLKKRKIQFKAQVTKAFERCDCISSFTRFVNRTEGKKAFSSQIQCEMCKYALENLQMFSFAPRCTFITDKVTLQIAMWILFDWDLLKMLNWKKKRRKRMTKKRQCNESNQPENIARRIWSSTYTVTLSKVMASVALAIFNPANGCWMLFLS